MAKERDLALYESWIKVRQLGFNFGFYCLAAV